MRIPCAFRWWECKDFAAKAKRRCELQCAKVPFWVKVLLSESCPFLGEKLTDAEIDAFVDDRWHWKNEGRW